MQVTAYKTHKITVGENIETILDSYLLALSENSVVSITSKILALSQGDVIKNDGKIDKDTLVKQESDFYIENPSSFGNVILTIKNNLLLFTAGIDESNTNGYFLLWPRHLQTATNNIWKYLKSKHKISNLGIIVTDSRLVPMRSGVLGFGLSWCGFRGLNNFIGKPDIFGRAINMTKVNVVESLATAATVVMGETDEQTPLAVITDVPFVSFQNHPPTKTELSEMNISLQDDMYGKLLSSVKWNKGGGGYELK